MNRTWREWFMIKPELRWTCGSQIMIFWIFSLQLIQFKCNIEIDGERNHVEALKSLFNEQPPVTFANSSTESSSMSMSITETDAGHEGDEGVVSSQQAMLTTLNQESMSISTVHTVIRH